jgi:mono/diheme cytochrome c family protein
MVVMFRLRRSPAPFRTRTALLAVHLLLAGTAVLAACKAQPEDSGGAAAPVVAQSVGADVYTRACARCHGADRQGDGTAPALSAVRMASLGTQPLEMTILYGQGEMPGFGGLSASQVAELVEYLRAA